MGWRAGGALLHKEYIPVNEPGSQHRPHPDQLLISASDPPSPGLRGAPCTGFLHGRARSCRWNSALHEPPPPDAALPVAGAVLGFGASSSGSKLSFTWRATIGWPFRELLSQRMPLTTQLAFRLQGEITFYINWELFYHGSLIHLHIALSDKRKKCKGGPRGRPHWRQLTPIYQTMSEGGQAWTMLKFGPKAGQTRPVIWVFSAARSRLPRAVWFGSDLTSQSGLTTCLGLQCRVKQVLYQ